MQVGWLGLGAMGGPMAARAARTGHVVRGCDVVPGRAAAPAADGVRPVDTVAAAVGGADLIVIMVATPEQLEEALFAPGGAAGSLAAGSIVVVMATVGPEAVVSAADRLAARGVAVVDAPVSGGTARAASGDLLIMVSGPEEPVARAQPVLTALARSAPVVGSSPGDGQRMKLVNQLLCGVRIAAAATALAFAEALGLTAAECWRVLREGAAAGIATHGRPDPHHARRLRRRRPLPRNGHRQFQRAPRLVRPRTDTYRDTPLRPGRPEDGGQRSGHPGAREPHPEPVRR
ncbi:MAG: NAD(P)-dependent oxidoreductase [Streptosporangiales bacterium]